MQMSPYAIITVASLGQGSAYELIYAQPTRYTVYLISASVFLSERSLKIYFAPGESIAKIPFKRVFKIPG